MHRFNRLIIGIILSIMILSPAFAESVTIVTGEWPPFVTESLPRGGIYTQIITAAFQAEKIFVDYQFQPWRRVITEIKEGTSLAGYPFVYTQERETFSHKADPLAKGVDVFVYMKDRLTDFDYTDLKSLKNYTIAGLMGYSHVEDFKNAGLTVDLSPSVDTALKKLQKNSVDLVCDNEIVIKMKIKEIFPGKESRFSFAKTPYTVDDMCLIFSKKHPDALKYLERFNSGLKKIKASGEYDKILN